MTEARIARIFDVETTGLPGEADAFVCEMGWIDVDLTSPTFDVLLPTARQTLVHPGVKMRPELSAIHHLTDEDLKDAPLMGQVAIDLITGVGPDDVFVAHNAKMEQHFFPFPEQPVTWIDTYKCALRAWPDAPRHTNQVLRYWLQDQGLVSVDRAMADPPHRAFPDAYVTAHIFSALMKMGRPLQRLIDISAQFAFLPKFTFGKHAGKKFSEAPRDYLDWIVNKSDFGETDRDVYETALYWLRKPA